MIAIPPIARQPMLLATGERMLLDIPDADRAEWVNSVEEKERARVREIFRCFAEILAARSLHAGARTAALKRHHLGWGWSAKTLLVLFWASDLLTHHGRKEGKSGTKKSPWRVKTERI